MNIHLLVRSSLVLFFLLESTGIRNVPNGSPELGTKSGVKEVRETSLSKLSEMSVEISTPTHKVILFNAEEKEEETSSDIREIPHLVLNRDGVLTPGHERTLEIVANKVPVFEPGVYVVLTISTQHIDPDHEGKDGNRIQVWNSKQFVPYTDQTRQGVRLTYSVTFNRYTKINKKTIGTPTDYFQYRISIMDINGNLKQSHTENFAFLMENQWRVPLPKLLETEPGAAPKELLIYYCDMTPFQANMRDPLSKVPRQDVERYIQVELIPAMVSAIQMQSNEWGFAWYPEWRNFRKDENAKTLSVALGEHGVWFHGEAPPLGNAMISIRVDGSVGEYDNLTDGIMSIFHHELFHNLQRNISLHFAKNGNVAGKDEAWKLFSEGTAVLASSVGQPQVQFDRNAATRSYMKRANAFIGAEGIFGGGLNKSYEKIPYHTAMYWRFLYEKCGGVVNGQERSNAGMSVIRTILEILYKGESVDINTSTNWTESMPNIMDIALARSPSCPFNGYTESLSWFAYSIYLLKVEHGRCGISSNNDCSFFDPNSLYNLPSAENVLIDARPTTYISGKIPTSYGIDFVDIVLDSTINRKSLQILLDKSSASYADFTVQFVMTKKKGSKPVLVKESNISTTENGQLSFEIGSVNLDEFDCIGLIITRTDSNVKLDINGSYTIRAMVR